MVFNVFISYSEKDEEKIRLVLNSIRTIKDTNIFFAPETLKIGDKISQEIINSIKNSHMFIVFYSNNSTQSNYVQQEIGVAKANSKLIIPVLLDRTKPTGMLLDINYLNLSNEKEYSLGINKLYNLIFSKSEQLMRNQGLLILGALGLLVYFASKGDK